MLLNRRQNLRFTLHMSAKLYYKGCDLGYFPTRDINRDSIFIEGNNIALTLDDCVEIEICASPKQFQSLWVYATVIRKDDQGISVKFIKPLPESHLLLSRQ